MLLIARVRNFHRVIVTNGEYCVAALNLLIWTREGNLAVRLRLSNGGVDRKAKHRRKLGCNIFLNTVEQHVFGRRGRIETEVT